MASGSRRVVDQRRLVAEARPAHVVGDGRVDHVRRQRRGGGDQVGALQGRRPGVEHRLAVGFVHVGQQVEQALPVAGHVVMVLHADRHAQRRGEAGALLQRPHAPAPLLVERRAALLEAGEDADQAAVEVVGQAAQFADVEDLHFARRDVGPVGAHAEVGVAGQAGDLQTELGQPVAQAAAGVGVAIERPTGAAAWP